MSRRVIGVLVIGLLAFGQMTAPPSAHAQPPSARLPVLTLSPAPSPDCIATGRPNEWYCHGVPDPTQPDPNDVGMSIDEVGRREHPELYTRVDKLPPLPDQATLMKMSKKEMKALIKSRNPNAVLEIAGIPLEEISEILELHYDQLAAISGVEGWGIDKDGIGVNVGQTHGDVPTQIEGVPVHLLPSLGISVQAAGATYNTPIRPVEGVTEFALPLTWPNSVGIINASVLVRGKPDLLFPAHLLIGSACASNPPSAFPFYSGIPLRQIPRYGLTGNTMYQPAGAGFKIVVGYPQTWDPVANHQTLNNPGYDLVAATADNNLVANDFSLGTTSIPGYTGSVDALETDGYLPVGPDVKGNKWRVNGVIGPYPGQGLYLVTANMKNSGFYTKNAYVQDVDKVIGARVDCNGTVITHYSKHNVIIRTTAVKLEFGDSGSVLHSAGFSGDVPDYYIGSLNWVVTVPTDPVEDRMVGGGLMYKGMVEGLKLEDNLSNLQPTVRYPDANWNIVPSLVTSQATTRLEHWLSPTESFSTYAVNEKCFNHYVWNTSPTIWAVGTGTEIDPWATPAPPTSAKATFRYKNPSGAYNTPYKIAPNATAIEQVCFYNSVTTPEQTYVLNSSCINCIGGVQVRGLNTVLAKWTQAAADHSFDISATTSTNTSTIHVPGSAGMAKFAITVTNRGTSIYGDAVGVGLTLHPTEDTTSTLPLHVELCQTLDGTNCFYWNSTTGLRVFNNGPASWSQDTTLSRGHEDQWLVGQTRKFIGRVTASGDVPWNRYYNIVYTVVHVGGSGVEDDIIDSFGARWAMLGLSVTTH